MNAAEFFMANFGKYYLPNPSGDAFSDTGKVLSSAYPVPGRVNKNGGPVTNRLSSGWAIVRPGSATVQLDFGLPGPEYSAMTRIEAYQRELETWDGKEPRIFLEFEKATIQFDQVFMTVDKRLVRICTPKGPVTRNWVALPPGVKPPRPPAVKKPRSTTSKA